MATNAANVHEIVGDLIDEYVEDLMEISELFDRVEEALEECSTVDDDASGYESDDETASLPASTQQNQTPTTWSTPTSVTDIQRHVPGPNFIPHLGYLAAGVTLRQDLAARMVAMIFVAEELRWTWSRFNNIIDIFWFWRWVSESFMERMRAICVPDDVAENEEGVSAD
jgi:hypothetical protein